ncbi:MAG: PAS domain S-box protein [Verrucomicrobia bacterium]|nr:PAS domain S-box protein [Verrucomicrobiota bacterium]
MKRKNGFWFSVFGFGGAVLFTSASTPVTPPKPDRFSGGALAVASLLTATSIGFAQGTAAPTATNGSSVLMDAKSVRELSPEEAARGHPVRLRGVVTYVDPIRSALFVQDAAGGVSVELNEKISGLAAGKLVEIDGFSRFDRIATTVVKSRVRTVGDAPLPVPVSAASETLASGRLHGQWVEARGVVRSVAESGGQIQLALAEAGLVTTVWVSGIEPARSLARLIDATVRVQGVSAAHFDTTRRLVGFHLYVSGPELIRLETPPPENPFNIPLRQIADLPSLTPEREAHRVKVHGVVTLQRLGRMLIIEDPTGALEVETRQSEAVPVGDRVEVAGFPAAASPAPILQDAIFRRTGVGRAPIPMEVTAEQASSLDYHGRLVRIRGQLLDRTVRPDSSVLVLQGSGAIFPAFFGDLSSEAALKDVREGSLLELTGICLLDPKNSQFPQTFRILLRSIRDVAVLRSPPWWTSRHAIGAIGGLSAVIVAALAWVALLKRRVRQQTDTIRRRLEAEAALKERYGELFENATDMVYTHDLEGRFKSVNKATQRLLGYTREEMLESDVFHIVAPEYRALSRGMLDRKLKRGGTTTYEMELVAKNGRRLWVEVSSRLIVQEDKPVGVHGVVRDIAERKKSEQRTATLSNLAYRLSACRSPKQAAEIIIEVADELFGWDACYLHLFTADYAEVIPVVHFDSVAGERVAVSGGYVDMRPSAMDLTVRDQGKRLILRATPAFEGTAPLIPFGDKARPSASLMFVPIRHGPNTIGILSIQSYTPRAYAEDDLDTLQGLADHCGGALERMRAAQAFEESERRFHKAFEATPVSISISTLADGRIVDVNDGFLQLFGFTRQEVIGQTAEALGTWARFEQRTEIIRLLRAQQRVRNRECQLRTRTGEVLDTLISAELIDFGNEPCVLFITYDLSERLRLEAQLRHAQKMEAVGQLAAGIAHDFNNIMTIIQGHTSLLLAAPSCAGETAESLRRILVAVERAASLTRQLLTFSRKQMLQPRLLDLRDVIRQVAKLLQRLLGDDVVLKCQYPPVLPVIWADAGMMEQIIINLAVNARDAMPDGGELALSASSVEFGPNAAHRHAEARPGRFVRLTVADTGCGMDAATLDKIFEPFFTTKAVGKGTGLGLAMVYGIVQQHRGWIEVASEEGRGAVFSLYFPAESGPAEPAATLGPQPALPQGTETVLVVEDEPVLRHLVSHILERQGYHVLEAGTGKEALQLWRQHERQVDLLLTDVVMPEGVSGVDLAEQLVAEKPSLKVVYTSGYSQDVAGQRVALEEGVNFLPKPYHPPKLAQIIRACLDSQSHESRRIPH